MSKVKIEYYALFREQANCNEEYIDTDARNIDDLYRELKARHGFSLEAEQLRVAINAEFSDWNSLLSNGDTVVFIPPVAGG